jgi:hypothetical protein
MIVLRQTILLLLFICLLYGALAQSVVINNPSTCNIGLNLVDGACDPSVNVLPDPEVVAINVNNAPGTALGVDVFLQEVQLIITHTWTNDLDITLSSPAGITIPLAQDNGGGDDNYGDITQANCEGVVRFSMASCNAIIGATPPFTDQVYRPQGSFFAFNDSITSPNDFWELSICDDASGDLGRLEYVNLIFAPISCTPVEAVNILNIDSTTVVVGWTPEVSCGSSIIEYGPAGFQPGSGTDAGIGGTIELSNGCPPFELTGLQPTTAYDLYVRKNCNGTISDNSCPTSFTTGCLPPAITLRADFDLLQSCPGFCNTDCDFDGLWQNSENNDFDWLVNSGGTFTFGTGPEQDVNGNGNYLYIEASGEICADDKTAYLVSNCIQFDKQGTDSCHLSFNYHMYGDGIGSLSFEVSEDGGTLWQPVWSKSGNQGDQWIKEYISLSGFEDGSTLQFRFVAQEGTSSRGDIALDEIIFYGSTNLGEPDFTYFADLDNDGFGDENNRLLSCSPSPPAGYVSIAGDCNDSDQLINPGVAEIPCNNTDENCNGNSDNFILAPPTVTSDTICPGEGALLYASDFEYFVFWYGSPEGDDFIGFSSPLILNSSQLPNDTPFPITYTFYAEDSNGECTSGSRAAAVVVVNPQPEVTLQDQPAICPGESLDLSSLNFVDNTLTGGTISFHSGLPTSMANELDNSVVSPLTTTTYYYRLMAAGGCFDEGSITVTVKDGPALNFMPADSFSLCRENRTTISVSPQIPGNYSYLWSTGSPSTAIEVEANFMAGSTDLYSVTVTDEEGCFSTDTVKVNTTVSIDSLRRFVTDVSSCSGDDGSITLIPLDGTSPFAYQWEGTNGISGSVADVTDTLTIDNLSQGAYRITVTDNSEQACDLVLRSVIVNGPAAVIQDVDIQPVSCASASDGSICLSFFGGNPNISWSTGENTSCIENLAGGSYSVTVTEGECETIIDSIIIDEPVELTITEEITLPTCAASTDGSINITALGGTPPYTYFWDIPALFEDVDNLSAGTYTLTLTDFNGCELIRAYELSAPEPVMVSTASISNMSCTGIPDGAIQVNVSGGTPPYQYAWPNGSTSPLSTNLSAGTYELSVTDFNNCVQTFSADILEPSPVSLSLVSTNNPECVGEKDGSIVVAASGGTAPYSYSWNVPGQDSLLENLAVGDYTAYATDANNCPPDSLVIALNAISVLDLDIEVEPPLCVGPSSGVITLHPQGTPPFMYTWCRGDTGNVLNNVEIGEYCVRIEDGQGCLYDTAVIVEAPQVFGVDFNIVQPTCFGDEDGIIDVNIFNPGGVPTYMPPISYNWNDMSTGGLRIGIGDGNYQVTISDTQGCEYVSDSIAIAAPDPLGLAIEGIGIIPCHGDTTGFIEISMRGGVQPYSYNWIEQDITTEDLFNIGAGDYRLLVLDANNCPIDTTFLLESPEPLTAEIAVQSEDICEGGMVEEICAELSGGVEPYSLLWSNDSTSNCLLFPSPADYTVEVTDANGCVETSVPKKVKAFTAPFQLDTFYVSDVSCHNFNDGCAFAVVSGGSSIYNFHLEGSPIVDTSSNVQAFCGLSPGNYQITVTDITTGCFDVSPVIELQAPAPLQFQRDAVDPVNCYNGIDGGVYTSTNGGTPPYTYYWEDEAGMSLPDSVADITNLGPGVYTGFVVDDNGCTASISATINNVNALIRDTLVNITGVDCKGDSTGAIQLNILGGAPPFDYAWSHGSTSLQQDMLPAGVYDLTVTDSDTCVAIFTAYEVEEPDSAIMLMASLDTVKCYGEETGGIALTITGGVLPYAYEWQYNGNLLATTDTTVLDNLPAGDYQLRLQDANACIRFFDVEISQPESALSLQIDFTDPNPPASGTATAIVEGGTPGYQYMWSTGDSTQAIMVDFGNYSLTVTDANDCTVDDMIVISSSYAVHEAIESIRLYPNPAKEVLYLNAVFRSPMAPSLEIINTHGENILSKQLQKSPGLNELLTVGHLPAGTYYLLMRSDGRLLYSAIFIKQ